MAFSPVRTRSFLAGWIALAGLALLALLLFIQSVRIPLGPGTVRLLLLVFICLGLFGLLLYRLWALYSLDYWVDRDAVRLQWAAETVVIPMADLQAVEASTSPAQKRLRWWQWPAEWVERWQPGRIQSRYATCPPEQCLLLHTTDGRILVSPEDAEGFMGAVASRKAFGSDRDLRMEVVPRYDSASWLIGDRWAMAMILAGLVLGILLLGYVVWQYVQLPESIVLHFNAQGQPDRFGPRRSVFVIPGIMLLIWFFNTAVGIALYERERAASYILWGSTIILQIVGWFVATNLIAMVSGG